MFRQTGFLIPSGILIILPLQFRRCFGILLNKQVAFTEKTGRKAAGDMS
jgi:hypothetical protein